MIIEKRTGDEDVTVVVQFEDNIALVGNFEIKTGMVDVSENGNDLSGDGKEFIGLMGNLEKDCPPISVIISKEIFELMKEVWDKK